MKTDKQILQGRMFRRYITHFLLHIAIFAGLTFIIFFGLLFLGNIGFFHFNNLLYQLGNFLARNVIIFLLLWGILGAAAILAYNAWRVSADLAALTTVIEQIAHHRDEELILPPSLADAQLMLRQVQLEAIRNDELAREAEQRKNDLVVYLAHDLKTPLTSVLGYLTLLRDEKEISPELQAKYLEIATAKAQRLEDLINEFFEITRFNLKGLVLEPTQFNFSRMLEQMNDEFAPLYAEKDITPVLELQPEIELVADAGKLERVLDNLLRNAVNYSHNGTEVLITAFTQENGVRLVVRNEGDTIPEHKLAKIFEQFYRLDSSRSASAGGSGLGLAIAKEIVELHGGNIAAMSSDGIVQFEVLLPFAPTGLVPSFAVTGSVPVL